MGAVTFSDRIFVKGDDNDAYRKACDEANAYNGHQEGYSGDIQTTYGFINLTSKAPRFGTKAFNKWRDDVIENDKFGVTKRGNAACVEITGKKFKEMKESRGLKGKKGFRAFYFFGWGAE